MTKFIKLNPVKTPVHVESFYRSQIISIIKELRDSIIEELRPLLKDFYDDKKQVSDSIVSDASGPIITEKIKRVLSNQFIGGELTFYKRIKKISDEFIDRLNQYNRTKIISSLRQGKVDESLLGTVDMQSIVDRKDVSEELELAIEENISLIKSIPQQYLSNIQKAVYSNLTGNLGYRSLIDAINNCGAKETSRAKLIARDQTAKLNANLDRIRSQNLGVEMFQWVTSHDSRVRASHRKLNGKYFLWDDWRGSEKNRPIAPDGKVVQNPPKNDKGQKMLPGMDYQCRCVAKSVINSETV